MGFNDYIKDYGVRTEEAKEVERDVSISCYDPHEAKRSKRKERSFDWDTWLPRIFWGIMCGSAVVQFIRIIIDLKKETKE